MFFAKQNPTSSSDHQHRHPAATAPLHSYLPPTIIPARKVSFEDAQDPLLMNSNNGSSSLASATKILPQVAEESPPSLPRMVSSSSGSLKRRPTSLSLVDLVAAPNNDDDAIMTAAPVSPLLSTKEEQQTPGQGTCSCSSSPHSSSPWGHFVDHLSPSRSAAQDEEQMLVQGSSSFLPSSLSYNPHKRIPLVKRNHHKNRGGGRAPFHAPYPKYTLKAKKHPHSKYPASLSLSMTNSSKTANHTSFSLQPKPHTKNTEQESESTMLLSAMTLLRMD